MSLCVTGNGAGLSVRNVAESPSQANSTHFCNFLLSRNSDRLGLNVLSLLISNECC